MQAAVVDRKRKWTHPELLSEQVAGRYAVDSLIARGGMGEVYAARDEILRRDVAIKVIRSKYDSTLMERLTREACIAAGFDHPNIVRVFDLGRTEDEHPFLVMELLRGKLFTELLAEEGPMQVDRVIELLEDVAHALDLVHQQGVVHRDLKPSNLMEV